MTDNLLEYRAKTQRAARERSGEAVYVASDEEAQVVFEIMLRSSRDYIHVLSQDLPPSVFSHIYTLDVADNFFSRAQRNLRMIVGSHDYQYWANHDFIKKYNHLKNFKWRILPESIADRIDYQFITMDTDSYLFQPKKTELSGAVLFGHAAQAERFEKIYNNIWDLSLDPEDIAPALDLQRA